MLSPRVRSPQKKPVILRREIEKAEAAEFAKAAGGAPATGRVTARQIVSYMDKNGDGKIGKDEASEEVKAVL